MTPPENIVHSVAAIHAAPPRLVYVFAGAGALALHWLHAVAGSSRTVLEARDCYAPASLAAVVGGPPAQAVSAATARAMATWAAERAAILATGDWPLLGVACTAAIATDRERLGTDCAYVAVWSKTRPCWYELDLPRGAGRAAHEELVSRLVIQTIAQACREE
jgi:hypothetical protein